jgi:hypothetical protein
MKLLKQPIGMLGTHGDPSSSSSSSKGKVGYKGVTTKDIQRRARWIAHMHGPSSPSPLPPPPPSLLMGLGIAEIRALQHHSHLEHLSSGKDEGRGGGSGGTFSRRKMSSLNQFSSLDHQPYAVITLSEFGIPKKWSWRGIPLDEETNIGMPLFLLPSPSFLVPGTSLMISF